MEPVLHDILVFLPVEEALTLALQQEPGIYDHAFRKNIILITPSTLKRVKSLWKQEPNPVISTTNSLGSRYP